MRTAFIQTLFELAQKDPRIVLIVGDLGFGVVTEFRDRLPAQFVNAGVAEQNMTGLAAGMALSGKIVFTYSIANFPTIRCLEQIRNDVCYHAANVKVVAVGGGLAYGALGMTHHATEDLAMMRVLPGMTVVAPGDPVETACAVRAIVEHPGPCYLRLGRAGEAAVHPSGIAYQLGKALLLTDGSDVSIITTGGTLGISVAAARRLELQGIQARVLSMHTVSPLDEEAVLLAAAQTRAVVTVEEHSIIGGLGGAVAEVLAERGRSGVPLKRVGLPHCFLPETGSQEYLVARYGISEEGILSAVDALLGTSTATR